MEDAPFLPNVYVAKSKGAEVSLAAFYDCIIDYFGQPESEKINVGIDFDESSQCNSITLYPTDDASGVLFAHAPETCPMRELRKNQSPLKETNQSVNMAVSVLLENEKNEVLITKRAAHMRTFPSVWVIPGGHIERNETHKIALAREVKEETGITVDPNSLQLFMLYESVFPVKIELGMPKRKHIVLYLKGKIQSSEVQLSLDPQEVEAAAWVNVDTLRTALSNEVTQKTFDAFNFAENNKDLKPTKLPISVLQSIPDTNNQLPLERLSTGTRIVLTEWMNS